jgi:hypothetical protein
MLDIDRTHLYGGSPDVICSLELQPSEFCYVQYLPIKMVEHPGSIRIPQGLHWVAELLLKVHNIESFYNRYVYLTVKHFYVETASAANREGWHSDGFMSNDVNYIWYSDMPTQFCNQEFKLTHDHSLSIIEMNDQADPANIVTYPNNTLLRMDERVIHRVNHDCTFKGVRTFIKVSFSDQKYNLKGNTHNYLFDYEWDMIDRSVNRNDPTGGQQ